MYEHANSNTLNVTVDECDVINQVNIFVIYLQITDVKRIQANQGSRQSTHNGLL